MSTFCLDNGVSLRFDTTSDGKIVLLDNLVKKSVYILDSEGKTLSIIPLEGKLVFYAPSATEIMCAKGGKFPGIWVGVEERSVRIAMPDGRPDTDRLSLPGIFFWDGSGLMRTQKIGDATASVQFSKKRIALHFGTIRSISFSISLSFIYWVYGMPVMEESILVHILKTENPQTPL